MRHYMLPILAFTLFCVCSAHAADVQPPAVTPQALYLQAGKLERQGEISRASDIYEKVITLFPESEFAVKANDRLLLLSATPATRPAQQEPAPLPQPQKPVSGLERLFTPSPLPPLPDEPRTRRAVELARRHQQAREIRDNEMSRQLAKFTTQYGHRYSRAKFAEQQQTWESETAQKIKAEIGQDINEIELELNNACAGLGLPARCSEHDIRQVR